MTTMTERLAARLMKCGANKEKQNILWNMAGSFCYAFASMVLSFLVMGIMGEEQGGIFAFGFSTFGQQMFILAYFGIRPFQITDGAGEYRFGDYFRHRLITCGLAAAAGAAYLFLGSGYTAEKAVIVFLLVLYKVIDGFADVYESEFQRTGNLYLTGRSNTFRTILSVGVFLLTLLAGRNLAAACMAAVAAQAAGVLLFDVLVLKYLPQADRHGSFGRSFPLTQATWLLFLSVFLDFYIFSAAKYAIDGCMGDAASGYFNVIFMPTSVINLAAGFVIRPALTYLTEYWNQKRYGAFKAMLFKISLVIGAFALLAVGLTWLIGKPVLGLMEMILGGAYEGRLTAYHRAFVLVVAGGGFYALLNPYYYMLVIMRQQKWIFGIYAVMTVFAAFLAPAMVERRGIDGAAEAYLLLMIGMTAAFGFGAVMAFRKGKK